MGQLAISTFSLAVAGKTGLLVPVPHVSNSPVGYLVHFLGCGRGASEGKIPKYCQGLELAYYHFLHILLAKVGYITPPQLQGVGK